MIDFSSNPIDFSDTRDADEPWPAGIYGPANIVDAQFSTSQAGNPMINLRFCVQEGEAQGQNFFYRIVISPRGMPFVKRDFNRLGIDTTVPIAPTAELFLGRQALLKVTIDEWEGRLRNQIKEILPLTQNTTPADDVF